MAGGGAGVGDRQVGSTICWGERPSQLLSTSRSSFIPLLNLTGSLTDRAGALAISLLHYLGAKSLLARGPSCGTLEPYPQQPAALLNRPPRCMARMARDSIRWALFDINRPRFSPLLDL